VDIDIDIDIDTVPLTRTTTHGDLDPQHTVWKAEAATP